MVTKLSFGARERVSANPRLSCTVEELLAFLRCPSRYNGFICIKERRACLTVLPLTHTLAFRESRIILTWDLDFTEIVALSKTSTVSAVVFRLLNTRSDHVIARLGRVLAVSAQDLHEGAIIAVEEGRHRVRLLPLGRER